MLTNEILKILLNDDRKINFKSHTGQEVPKRLPRNPMEFIKNFLDYLIKSGDIESSDTWTSEQKKEILDNWYTYINIIKDWIANN